MSALANAGLSGCSDSAAGLRYELRRGTITSSPELELETLRVRCIVERPRGRDRFDAVLSLLAQRLVLESLVALEREVAALVLPYRRPDHASDSVEPVLPL